MSFLSIIKRRSRKESAQTIRAPLWSRQGQFPFDRAFNNLVILSPYLSPNILEYASPIKFITDLQLASKNSVKNNRRLSANVEILESERRVLSNDEPLVHERRSIEVSGDRSDTVSLEGAFVNEGEFAEMMPCAVDLVRVQPVSLRGDLPKQRHRIGWASVDLNKHLESNTAAKQGLLFSSY